MAFTRICIDSEKNYEYIKIKFDTGAYIRNLGHVFDISYTYNVSTSVAVIIYVFVYVDADKNGFDICRRFSSACDIDKIPLNAEKIRRNR